MRLFPKSINITVLLATQLLIQLVFLCIFPLNSYGQWDGSFYEDAAPQYNEQGYLKGSSFSNAGIVKINNFNGNMVYKKPLYTFAGEGGFDLKIALTYNGSTPHSIVGRLRDVSNQMSSPFGINAPEWILSVNGIGVQVFNFETNMYNWTDASSEGSKRDSIALLVSGYHMNVSQSFSPRRSRIELLLEDGTSDVIIDTTKSPTVQDSGLHLADGKRSFNTAWTDLHTTGGVWWKEFWVKRGDGTTIYGRTHNPKYKSGYQEQCFGGWYGLQVQDTIGMFVPDSMYDNHGNVITLEYDSTYILGADSNKTIYAHPLLKKITLNHDTARSITIFYTFSKDSITQISIGDYDLDIFSRPDDSTYPTLNGIANRGYITRITDPVGRETEFNYERYARSITYFDSLASGKDSIGNTCTYRIGSARHMYPDFYRINEVIDHTGGISRFKYFEASGTDSITINYNISYINYKHLSPSVRYDEHFNATGRDAFFTNMVSSYSLYTKLGITETLVAKDSLVFSWIRHGDTLSYEQSDSLITEIYSDSVSNPVTGGSKSRYTYVMYPYSRYGDATTFDRWALSWNMSLLEECNEYDTTTYVYDVGTCGAIPPNGPGCDGTFRLLSKTFNRNGISTTTNYGFDLADDGFNFESDTVYSPLGINRVRSIDDTYLNVSSDISLYLNKNYSSEKTFDSSDDSLLFERTAVYYTDSTANGNKGQLKEVVTYEIKNGSRVDSNKTLLSYYHNAQEGYGNLKKLVMPGGDSVSLFYHLPDTVVGSDTFNISYDVIDKNGDTTAARERIPVFKSKYSILDKYVDGDTLRILRGYNKYGAVTRVVNFEGELSLHEYDDIVRIKRITLPLGFDSVLTNSNNLTSTDSLFGFDTEYKYKDTTTSDEYNTVTIARRLYRDTTLVIGSDTFYTVDVKVSSEFDGLRRNIQTELISMDDTYDSVTSKFNHFNLAKSNTDQLGNETSLLYDKIRQQVKSIYPDDSASTDSTVFATTEMDSLPSSVTIHTSLEDQFLAVTENINENGDKNLNYEDSEGQLRFIAQYLGSDTLWTIFDYDKLGNATKVRRPEGDEVLYKSNSLGQVIEEVSADYDTVKYLYGNNGKLSRKKDGNQTLQDSIGGDTLLDNAQALNDFPGTTEYDTIYVKGSGYVNYHLSINSSNGHNATWSQIFLNGILQEQIQGCIGTCDSTGSFNVLAGDIVEVIAKVHQFDGAGVLAQADLYVQGTVSNWTYNNYDELNRPITTGLMRIDYMCYDESCWDADTISITPINRVFYDQSNSTYSKGLVSMSLSNENGYDYGEWFYYDSRSRLIKQVNYFNAVLDSTLVGGVYEYELSGDSFVVQYTYNAGDEIESITYPDSMIVTYTYDDRGRLWKVGDENDPDKYASYTYTKRDEISQMVLGAQMLPGGKNVQTVDYDYNERGWLNSINNGVSSDTVGGDKFGQKLFYYEDSLATPPEVYFNGNILSQRIAIDGDATITRRYQYDDLDRLVDSDFWVIFSYLSDEKFTYDDNGNRETYKGYNGIVLRDSLNYVYRAGANFLDTLKGKLDTLSSYSNHFLYDENGNLKLNYKKGFIFYYDIFNQLKTVTKDNGSFTNDTVAFAYNVGGERVFKHFTHYWQAPCPPPPPPPSEQSFGGGGIQSLSGPGGGTCTYNSTANTFYILSKGKILAEYIAMSPTAKPLFKYIYAGNERIAMRQFPGDLHFYLNDHLGSAGVVIDSAGTIKDNTRYRAFGQIYSSVTNTGQDYTYTGKELDEEAALDLNYYGARYYDSFLGRFISVDPLLSKYPSFSPYTYAGNNPLTFLDPNGEDIGIAIDHNRAVGFGHAFLFIGNDKSGWHVFSFEVKEGTPFPINLLPLLAFGDATLETFSAGSLQEIIDGEKFMRGVYDADEVVLFKTTPGQDADALAIADLIVNDPGLYLVGSKNCLDMAVKVANGAGLGLPSGMSPNSYISMLKGELRGGTLFVSASWMRHLRMKQELEAQLKENRERQWPIGTDPGPLE